MQISDRIYNTQDVITFQKNKDQFGCFSNMFTKTPFIFNDVEIYTTEHLYQALKFTDSNLQKQILTIKNPIYCKRIAYEIGSKVSIRSDWEKIKISVMGMCLKLKSRHNFDFIGKKFIESFQINLSGDSKLLVEKSSRDDFWGAIPQNDTQTLKGKNVLGRLWMMIRDQYFENRESFKSEEFIKIPKCDLIFMGKNL